MRDDSGELEMPCDDGPASELLAVADPTGLETSCEEVPALALLAGPSETDDSGGTITLDSDEEESIIMLVRLVKALLVVST